MYKISDVTIIIVAYKSTHIINHCLDNIVNKGMRIIVVDNGSNDNLKEIFQENYPESSVELVLLEHNCGFGKANNVALEMVDSKFAFLLNPDAQINTKSITEILTILDKNPDVAIATPLDAKNLNPSQEEIDAAICVQKKEFEVYEENEEFMSMNFVSGGYMMLNMDVFRKIGFFDENIFLYGEDDEICFRSLKNGYKNILVKSSFADHISYNATKTEGKLDKYRLLFFRNWHMGWSKTYLKRQNKNYFRVLVKSLSRLLFVPFYFVTYDLNQAVKRSAIAVGSLSNLLGIDCFNKNNRVAKIKEHVKI